MLALGCCADCVQAIAGPAILPAESIGMPASAVGAFAALPPQYAGNHRVCCWHVLNTIDKALLVQCFARRLPDLKFANFLRVPMLFGSMRRHDRSRSTCWLGIAAV